MTILLLLCLVSFVILLLVAGINPRIETMSGFELHRRHKKGDKTAESALRRQALLADVLSLQKLVSSLFLVILVLLLVAALGWGIGTLISILVVLEYGALARLSFIQIKSQKLYEIYEKPLLDLIETYPKVLKLIRTVTPEWKKTLHIDSREELTQIVSGAGELLSKDEQKLILHGLDFPKKQIREIMTPRSSIVSISKAEMLGPLVLDDLHKTGHSRFPVIDQDIDHVAGILYIQDLLTVNSGKNSNTVAKTMSPRVFYIREDQPLDQALAAFLRTHHHLFIVVNEFRETVGIVSLEDVIEALLGRKIIDEFDTHEDIRTIAARNIQQNNIPKNHQNI